MGLIEISKAAILYNDVIQDINYTVTLYVENGFFWNLLDAAIYFFGGLFIGHIFTKIFTL